MKRPNRKDWAVIVCGSALLTLSYLAGRHGLLVPLKPTTLLVCTGPAGQSHRCLSQLLQKDLDQCQSYMALAAWAIAAAQKMSVLADDDLHLTCAYTDKITVDTAREPSEPQRRT